MRTVESRGTITVAVDRCKGCELCIPACPPQVLRMSTDRNELGVPYPELLPGCTGCGACVHVCPAKNKSISRLKAINMMPQAEHREVERESYDFFLALPEYAKCTSARVVVGQSAKESTRRPRQIRPARYAARRRSRWTAIDVCRKDW